MGKEMLFGEFDPDTAGTRKHEMGKVLVETAALSAVIARGEKG